MHSIFKICKVILVKAYSTNGKGGNMSTSRRIFMAILFASTLLLITSCGTVPKEVVELSYVAGKDLHSLHESYDTLIHQFFENLGSERREYLDNVWYPRFLENWKEDGELVGIAKGERIWSEIDGKLIDTPVDSDPKESLKTLDDWVSYALYAYEVKEQKLLKSLNDQEEQLRAQVKQAFEHMMMANATVTAHLNSLRKVQEVQDEVLKALDVKDLRDKINDGLINASVESAKGLDKIRVADAKIDDLVAEIKSYENKLQGEKKDDTQTRPNGNKRK